MTLLKASHLCSSLLFPPNSQTWCKFLINKFRDLILSWFSFFLFLLFEVVWGLGMHIIPSKKRKKEKEIMYAMLY